MPGTYRRVILKPPRLTDAQASLLAKRLASAVDHHQQLASHSRHVLQLIGGLEEDEDSFFVEHEPAEALAIERLFDQRLGAGEAELLDATVAILHALRTAQRADPPTVHGGLCPGVILANSQGIVKVADFGVAPAMCRALGQESYLNLAAGARPGEPGVTGVWEVLPAEVADRDDRICAFIDPEKYACGSYESFDAGGDIIAAGIILYLLAEVFYLQAGAGIMSFWGDYSRSISQGHASI